VRPILQRSWFLGCFALSCVVLGFTLRDASALTALELTVGELLSASSSVVSATGEESVSVWEDSDGARAHRIVTYTLVVVDRVLDGQEPGATVWVRTLGGHVGTIAQYVDGEAVLAPGQRHLLFLDKRSDGTHRVVGMSQGQFPLQDQGNARPPRVMRPAWLDRLVSRAGQRETAACVALPGRTLDEVAELLVGERAKHAR
jgi:hypothetical protein